MNNKPVFEFKDIHVSVENKEVVKGVSLTIRRERFTPSWARTVPGNRRCRTLWPGIRPMKSRREAPCLTAVILPTWPRTNVLVPASSSLSSTRGDSGRDGRQLPPYRPAGASRAGRRHVGFSQIAQERNEGAGVDEVFATRYINDGFSGGEKSESRSFRWPSFSRKWRFWTRPIPGSISTPSRRWPRDQPFSQRS